MGSRFSDLKEESEDKCLTERERKRVPDHWSDILKGSLGSPREYW